MQKETEHLILYTLKEGLQDKYIIGAKLVNEPTAVIADIPIADFSINIKGKNFLENICDDKRYKEFVYLLDTVQDLINNKK